VWNGGRGGGGNIGVVDVTERESEEGSAEVKRRKTGLGKREERAAS